MEKRDKIFIRSPVNFFHENLIAAIVATAAINTFGVKSPDNRPRVMPTKVKIPTNLNI